jgi:rhomboid family GlyGly-CTERM serine protease
MKIRIPWITVSLAVLACVLYAIPGAAEVLQFDRVTFSSGELWRVFTGHLVHFNRSHFNWDAFALLFLGGSAELLSRRGMIRTLGIAAPAISIAFWIFLPQFTAYRGLSGLDSALAGFGIAYLFRHAQRGHDRKTAAIAAFCALVFIGKSAFEIVTGQTLFASADTDFTAVPLAHLVGFAAGATASRLTPLAPPRDRRRASCNKPVRPRETPPASRFRWPPAPAASSLDR